MHQKQQQAEHKLQDSHIKSLENDIGAANMHKIYNDSIVQAQKKRKMDTTVDFTTEDNEDQNPMLSTIEPLVSTLTERLMGVFYRNFSLLGAILQRTGG